MATMCGAKALGLESEIGSLEIDKSADIIAVNLSSLSMQPVFNPIYSLIYSASGHHVSDVWVAGKSLLRNGELLTINEPSLMQRIAHWQNRITQFLCTNAVQTST